MNYYFLAFIPFILIGYQLAVTNILVPYFKKIKIVNELKTRSNWKLIEKKENILRTLYKGTHSKFLSKLYRFFHFIRSKEFIYGEIHFLSFYSILEKAKLADGEVFYDLGSGAGKAVLTAGLFFNVSTACGIELLPPLYHQANSIHNKVKKYLIHKDSIQFIKANFLNYDFYDADVVYVAATCLNDATWEELIEKMNQLKVGARIIVATRTISNKQFDLFYDGIELMSWGLCPVKIYIRI